MSSRWRLPTGLAVLLWCTAVYVAYYYTHKPLTLAQVPAVGQSALALVGWGGTLIWAHALGRVVAPALGELPPRERFALRIGLGLGLIGLLVLFLGAIGAYKPAVAWLLLLAAMPAVLRGFWSDARSILPAVPSTWTDRALAVFVLAGLAVAFANALAPPTAWDALVYHLTGPKLYLAAQHIHHNIDLPYLGFPHWPAMLFTWAMLLGGPVGPQIVHFTFALLTLALLPSLAEFVAPGRGWLAGALLLAAPALVTLAGWAYVEWIAMYCITAGALLLVRWRERTGDRRLALAGIFAGLALATKFTTGGAILGLAAAALVLRRPPATERSRFRGAARVLAIFGAVTLLTALPWLVKNWVLTGNPVYPFFFQGKLWDGFRAEWYGRWGTGMGPGELLAAPWTLMMAGAREADIGPLVLALAPLVAIGWRERPPETRRALAALLAACPVALAVWLAGLAGSALLRQYRLLYPIFPLLAVAGAAGFDGLGALDTPKLKIRWVAGGLVALAMVFTVVTSAQSLATADPLRVVLGVQSQDEYLADRLGMHYLAMQAVNELPPGHQVVFLWEPRSFYCRSGCEPDALLDRWWHLRRTVGDAATIADRWRAEGVTHVLMFESARQYVAGSGFDPITREDWNQLNALIRDDLTAVKDFDGVYRLYALR